MTYSKLGHLTAGKQGRHVGEHRLCLHAATGACGKMIYLGILFYHFCVSTNDR